MTRDKSYSVDEVLVDIDRCVFYSNGVFLKNSVSMSRKKRDALNQFIRHYPSAFTLIHKDGTSLFQASSLYLSQRGINKLVPNLDLNGILRSAVWSAFITQNGLDIPLPENEFKFLGNFSLLDDMKSDYSSFSGPIITSECRMKNFEGKAIVPKILLSKWGKRVIYSLTNSNKNEDISTTIPSLIEGNIVDGGIWPDDEYECHDDERAYPIIDEKISGIRKWNYDKYLLESGCQLPDGYKFGVYKLDNEVRS